jgi:hypothetical protein
MAERSKTRQARGGSASRSRQSSGSTRSAPNLGELNDMTVDKLRQLARDRGISGVSGLRKDDLVKAVAKGSSGTARGAGGVRRGAGTSKSLRYAQEITSPEDVPERPGRSLVTTDHDVIRQWAAERKAVPVLDQARARPMLAEPTLSGPPPHTRGVLFPADPLKDPRDVMPQGSNAVVLLLEHRWGARLRQAVADVGAYPVAGTWLSAAAVDELGLPPPG